MTRKINPRPISKQLDKLVKPVGYTRAALGLDKNIGEFYYLSTQELIPYHNQARINFDHEQLLELAKSIKLHGIRQPLTVIKSSTQPDKYEIVSGERRFRAAKLAELEKVPCIIIDDQQQAEEISIIENIHRIDLHPVEFGNALAKLLASKIFTNQNEMAKRLAISNSTVSEYLSYNKLDKNLKAHLIQNNLTTRSLLRKLVKAKNKQEINDLITTSDAKSTNSVKDFTILKFTYQAKQLSYQDLGINKLSAKQKGLLKEQLTKLIAQLD